MEVARGLTTLQKAGVPVTSPDAFFAAADDNGDKKIDLQEFLHVGVYINS